MGIRSDEIDKSALIVTKRWVADCAQVGQPAERTGTPEGVLHTAAMKRAGTKCACNIDCGARAHSDR